MMDYYLQCPHCGYEHGSTGDFGTTHYQDFEGEHGSFYKLTWQMQRGAAWYVNLHACPSCKKTFID